ncbi:uncharacterized protein [Nicotiana sylvestris]|uniref:uncharacterized protein n=1 Tax=Nicotiana sylvestris TaxID=4096 RepID=UPI00388C5618
MEGVNLLVNKRRQSGQQIQSNQDQYEQGSSGYNQDDGYCEQSEEVLYANNYQGQRGNAPNQQWRSQGNNQNWGNQGQGNWNNNNNNSNNWGKNNQNWGNNNNWGGNNNQGGWNSVNQEVQLVQILQSLNTRPKGALPSDMVVNSKGGNNIGDAMAVTTRSGRGGEASSSKQKEVVSDEVEVQNDDDPIVVEQVSEEKLDGKKSENQFKKFIKIMKSLSINVPLVEALEQMSGYAKFMKYLPNSTKVCSYVDLVTEVMVDGISAMINVDDSLEAVLLNHDVTEDEGRVKCVNALHGMGSYSYEPHKLSLDLENRKTPPTKPSIEEPPVDATLEVTTRL